MAQGYVKSLNLLEADAEADRGIFDNIAGPGISNDIQLFSGNLKKTSVLAAGEYAVSNGVVTVTADGRVPFSNRTIVTHNGRNYKVVLSDGQTQFRLIDVLNGSTLTPTMDLIRSDAVTFENLANMDAERIEAVRDSGAGLSTTDNNNEAGIYNLRTIAQNYEVIEEGLGIYFYKKSRIPLTFKDSSFNRRLEFAGNIRITNSANLPQSTTSPGLFIKGPAGAVRAFSDTSNPWTEVSSGAKLETTANHAAVYSLVLNGPNLVLPTSQIHTESGDARNYTHKMKVSVKSGSHDDPNSSYETFYILLST